MRPDTTLADLSDDALGSALDAPYEYGVTELFAQVAAHASEKFKLELHVYLDTTRLSVYGDTYETGGKAGESVRITHSHVGTSGLRVYTRRCSSSGGVVYSEAQAARDRARLAQIVRREAERAQKDRWHPTCRTFETAQATKQAAQAVLKPCCYHTAKFTVVARPWFGRWGRPRTNTRRSAPPGFADDHGMDLASLFPG